jgi:MSHA biogenesis protein MshP
MTRAASFHTERGFALPTAIFLLVVLAALGAYMVTLSRTSHLTSALDVQGARAYQAARAGIEWAAWQVIRPPAPAACPTSPPTVVLDATLAAFTVTVECIRSDAIDGADTVSSYQIIATATAGAADEPDYVERRIQAVFSR